MSSWKGLGSEGVVKASGGSGRASEGARGASEGPGRAWGMETEENIISPCVVIPWGRGRKRRKSRKIITWSAGPASLLQRCWGN